MKTKLIRTTVLGIAAISSLLLASCQTPSSTPSAAISCDKCHTIHFQAPSSGSVPGNKGIVSLRHAERMACPDCENQVTAMLRTGGITRHTCASCGGTLRHCMQH